MKRSELGLVSGLVALYALVAWYLSPYRIDDAYITFRYTANLAEGYGYVYNPGQWVEGASNLLWAILLVPFHWVGFFLPVAATFLGFVFYACLLAYLVLALSEDVKYDRVNLVLCVILPLVAVPVAPLWSVSGLEVSLFLLLITVGLVTGDPIPLFLASLTRPEGIAFLVVLPLIRESVPVKRYGLALCGWLGVALLRLWFYGTPLPQSVTAKSGPVVESVMQGVRYLQFGVVNHLGIFTVVGGILGLFMMMNYYLSLRAVAVVVLQVIVVCLAGGDWMPYSRLLLPILPVLVIGWLTLARTQYRQVIWGILGLLILLHASFYPTVKGYTRHLTGSVRDNVRAMKQIKNNLPSGVDRTMALADLGAFGWAARDWQVIDRVGLITPEISNQGRGLYRSYSPEYVLAQEPTLIQTHLSNDAPVSFSSTLDSVKYLVIEAKKENLSKWATWPGGEALYENERFQKKYRIYRAFRTPGNPINVFWLRDGFMILKDSNKD